ncbi:hypothetical protein PF007_g14972 [Phytophthora fragariae]|uniref:Uncharacterized protein n=1 Tax=Phytophthora fragariae TaxID=53985 RepID=A0A6A3RWM7_9STRA|nr:hypothetical protein PF003_g33630 [Phytophthora fragariae]KAE8937573.1 hypothetical protein PF009_g12523 [Phytophthora fragariae]KAE9101861.1 hypothetical protein PF007_g14972 [Phytophthora fragariae]KAE9110259.1 hypothetical protein PF006_g20494 [Phytophthora fragariae]KAE9294635.1 hypothetical protein PF001_g17689 [Phytophthora fragariae]
MALVAILTNALYCFCVLQRCPEARLVVVGGVHGNDGDANVFVLFWLWMVHGVRLARPRLVVASALAHRMLRLPDSKVRGRWWYAWRRWRC